MTTMAGTRIVDPSLQTAFTKQIRRGGGYRAGQLPGQKQQPPWHRRLTWGLSATRVRTGACGARTPVGRKSSRRAPPSGRLILRPAGQTPIGVPKSATVGFTSSSKSRYRMRMASRCEPPLNTISGSSVRHLSTTTGCCAADRTAASRRLRSPNRAAGFQLRLPAAPSAPQASRNRSRSTRRSAGSTARVGWSSTMQTTALAHSRPGTCVAAASSCAV